MEMTPHPDERSVPPDRPAARTNTTKVLAALPGEGWTAKRVVEKGQPHHQALWVCCTVTHSGDRRAVQDTCRG